MGRFAVVVSMVVLLGCVPEPANRNSGSTLTLSVAPSHPPEFTGAYDFDLLEAIGGQACAVAGDDHLYWVGLADLATLSSDPLTRQAIAAAALDAISRLDDADTIVITRVVADGKSSKRVCASVFGRGLRLTKAGESSKAKPRHGDEGQAAGSATE